VELLDDEDEDMALGGEPKGPEAAEEAAKPAAVAGGIKLPLYAMGDIGDV
jgi:hypothetical protein